MQNPYVRLDDAVKKIMKKTFPGFKGREVRIIVTDGTLDLASYWSGGSKSDFAFVRLTDMQAMPIPVQSPFDRPIRGIDAYKMSEGVAVVEWSYFSGKRMTPKIYVHPANVNQLELPAPQAELSFIQALVLLLSRMYTSSYRLEEFKRFTGLRKAEYEAARSGLFEMGLMTKNKALTTEGKNVAGQWRDEYALAEKYGVKRR